MYVRDILRDKGAEVFTIGPDATIRDLARTLTQKKIGAAVVVDEGGGLIGVISERDIVKCIADHGADCLSGEVRGLMTSDVVSCTPDTSIDEVMELMTERRFRHLPVIAGGALAGIVSIGDVVKTRIAEAEREADQLRQYISA